MKKVLLLFLVFLLTHPAFSQTIVTITTSMNKGDSLRQDGDLEGALKEFRNIYTKDTANYYNLYDYSCALAVNGDIDSAFNYLYKAVHVYTSLETLKDPDYINLYADKRWPVFEDSMIKLVGFILKHPYAKPELTKQYLRLRAMDFAYKLQIDLAEKKLGENSEIVKILRGWRERQNREDENVLEKLVAANGWPKKSVEGHIAAETAFFVVQHADLTSQKKYLPVIKRRCEEKEADWVHYALMYDRIQVSENKKQLYGSQLRLNEQTKKYEPWPIEDEANVDKRRKTIGMGPLKVYVGMSNGETEINLPGQ